MYDTKSTNHKGHKEKLDFNEKNQPGLQKTLLQKEK